MFWGETKVKQFSVRIVVYKTRRSMNKAIRRYFNTDKTALAFCGWTGDTVCLLFNERDLNHEVIAHEIYHAYEYFKRRKVRGLRLEEDVAISLGMLTQGVYEYLRSEGLTIS